MHLFVTCFRSRAFPYIQPFCLHFSCRFVTGRQKIYKELTYILEHMGGLNDKVKKYNTVMISINLTNIAKIHICLNSISYHQPFLHRDDMYEIPQRNSQIIEVVE